MQGFQNVYTPVTGMLHILALLTTCAAVVIEVSIILPPGSPINRSSPLILVLPANYTVMGSRVEFSYVPVLPTPSTSSPVTPVPPAQDTYVNVTVRVNTPLSANQLDNLRLEVAANLNISPDLIVVEQTLLRRRMLEEGGGGIITISIKIPGVSSNNNDTLNTTSNTNVSQSANISLGIINLSGLSTDEIIIKLQAIKVETVQSWFQTVGIQPELITELSVQVIRVAVQTTTEVTLGMTSTPTQAPIATPAPPTTPTQTSVVPVFPNWGYAIIAVSGVLIGGGMITWVIWRQHLKLPLQTEKQKRPQKLRSVIRVRIHRHY